MAQEEDNPSLDEQEKADGISPSWREDTKWLIQRQDSLYIGWIGLWLVSFFGLISILTSTTLIKDAPFYASVLYSILVVGVSFAWWRIYKAMEAGIPLFKRFPKYDDLYKRFNGFDNSDRIRKMLFPEDKEDENPSQNGYLVVSATQIIAFFLLLFLALVSLNGLGFVKSTIQVVHITVPISLFILILVSLHILGFPLKEFCKDFCKKNHA